MRLSRIAESSGETPTQSIGRDFEFWRRFLSEDRDLDLVLLDDGFTHGVSHHGAGADGEGALRRVVNLGVEGGGADYGGNLVHSAGKIAVITGYSLVTTHGHGDGLVGRNDVGVDGGSDRLVGELLGGGGGHHSGNNTSVVGQNRAVDCRCHHDGRISLGLGLPLPVDEGVMDKSASADRELHIAVGLSLLDSEGGDQAGDLVRGAAEVSVAAGLGLVAAHCHGHRVAGDHGGGGNCGVGQDHLGRGGGLGGSGQQEGEGGKHCH